MKVQETYWQAANVYDESTTIRNYCFQRKYNKSTHKLFWYTFICSHFAKAIEIWKRIKRDTKRTAVIGTRRKLVENFYNTTSGYQLAPKIRTDV